MQLYNNGRLKFLFLHKLSDKNLAKMYKNSEMPRYAVPMYTQTSNESGERNENKSGGCLIGLANKMLIPVLFDYECLR